MLLKGLVHFKFSFTTKKLGTIQKKYENSMKKVRGIPFPRQKILSENMRFISSKKARKVQNK
jgi:hypothetical protein